MNQRMIKTAAFSTLSLLPAEMDEIRSLDKEQRFFNIAYKEAEQFMLNWKIDQ